MNGFSTFHQGRRSSISWRCSRRDMINGPPSSALSTKSLSYAIFLRVIVFIWHTVYHFIIYIEYTTALKYYFSPIRNRVALNLNSRLLTINDTNNEIAKFIPACIYGLSFPLKIQIVTYITC